MKLTDIKKELNKLDKKKLADMVLELCKKNKSVKEYFDFFFQPNEIELFQKYKDKVFDSFFPRRGSRTKLKDAQLAISDFKRLEPSKNLQADLMLFYVECGVKLSGDFGGFDETLDKSTIRMCAQAFELMRKESLLEIFIERADKIMQAADGMGAGFDDALFDLNLNYFADYREDETDEEQIVNDTKTNEEKIIPLKKV